MKNLTALNADVKMSNPRQGSGIMKTLFVGALTAGWVVMAAAADPVPVARWTFDTPDLTSVPPAAGKVAGRFFRGGEYKYIAGVSGKALEFGAKIGGVVFPGLPVDFTQPFTVTVMLKLSPEINTPAGYRRFKDIWTTTGTRGPGVRLTIHYGAVAFNSGDGKEPASVRIPAASYPVRAGRWFQLATVYDGATVILYADGKAYATKKIHVTAPNAPFWIGSMHGYAYALPGAIDDLAIYDRALTAEEIAALTLEQAE